MACNLCGGESGKYFLCFKCNKLKDEGKALKCPECGQWHYADKACKCKVETKPAPSTSTVPKASSKDSKNDGNICIVCGNKAPNGSLCRDCYYEMRDFKDSFDKNTKVFDMKDGWRRFFETFVCISTTVWGLHCL